MQGALAARGITDQVLAAGQFNPRGQVITELGGQS